MQLPNANLARADRKKIQDYLLNESHPDGGPKAVFFAGFGFRRSDWQTLAAALLAHGKSHRVIAEVVSGFGVRYTVEGPLETPSGRKPSVRTVWIIDREATAPRLITAHPARRQR